MQLDTDIRYIKGIGEARARSMGKLGIHDHAGLVSYFPRAYEDRTRICPIDQLTDGESVCVRAMVAETPTLSRIRGGQEIVKVRAVDETGALHITFFHSSYVRLTLKRGQFYIFYGRVSVQGRLRSMVNPIFEAGYEPSRFTGRIVPIYRLTAGLSRLLRPGLGRLFPRAARDRDTMDALAANVSANFLGLGNAATPMGIRAAQGMARLSDRPGTASRELCLLVVLNTASIQLLPTTAAALRASAGSASPFDILPAVWLSSAASVTAGLLAASLLARLCGE